MAVKIQCTLLVNMKSSGELIHDLLHSNGSRPTISVKGMRIHVVHEEVIRSHEKDDPRPQKERIESVKLTLMDIFNKHRSIIHGDIYTKMIINQRVKSIT